MEPLKNKTLQYEQDYIESNIKWGLELGDDIFKKSDIKRALKWLKKQFESQDIITHTEFIKKINEAFEDIK